VREIARTLDTYEGDADEFVAKYQGGSIAAGHGDRFFEALSGPRVLDAGCGPGADAAVFEKRGLDVTGLDLTPSFLRAARDYVPEGSFARGDMRLLPFDDEAFDGVWCCAALLHVSRADAPATLREFRRVLDAGGVLFCSLKRGDESGYDADGRYFERYRPDEVRSLVRGAAFDAVDVTASENWVQVLARVRGGALPDGTQS